MDVDNNGKQPELFEDKGFWGFSGNSCKACGRLFVIEGRPDLSISNFISNGQWRFCNQNCFDRYQMETVIMMMTRKFDV